MFLLISWKKGSSVIKIEVKCAWCGKVIKAADVKVCEQTKISHGMCDDCKKSMLAEVAHENNYIARQIERFST